MSGMRELIQELAGRGVRLGVEQGQLRVRAPKGVVDDALRTRLASHKAELIAWLERDAAGEDRLPTVVPDPARRHEPFPLTDIQQAYWVGSSGGLEDGGGYHYYLEFDCADLDLVRLNAAWQALIDRHEMLRAVVLPDGRQQILAETPPYRFAVHELEGHADPETAVAAIRARLSHMERPLDRWPLFQIEVSRLAGGRQRLHVSLGLIVLDSGSMMILFDEWQRLYRTPDLRLPPLPTSFRDYVTAEARLADTPLYRRAEGYWRQRLDGLPPAPDLPTARGTGSGRFVRLTGGLDAPAWAALKQRAGRFGVTPSAVLLTAFSEVVATWSADPRFTLNLTLFNRLPMGEGISGVVGDFTSVTLLAVDFGARRAFAEHAAAVNRQLRDDLDHRAYSGVRVLREWAGRLGSTGRPLAPVVFSSTLVLDTNPDFSLHRLFGGSLCHAISQTPQCHLDHQLMEDEGQLVFHWDVLDGFYPDGMVDAMFAAYGALLARLAVDETAFTEVRTLALPAEQAARREAANTTAAAVPEGTLVDLFTAQTRRRPDAPAVVAGDVRLSYGELDRRARQVASLLRRQGVAREECVAVVMDKGWEQVVGVLGILMAGAAYLPVDIAQPTARRAHLLQEGEVRVALTQPGHRAALEADHPAVRWIAIEPRSDAVDPPPPSPSSPGDLAYVLYTSGSTGRPKGVMVEQRSVVNRMTDVVRRFGLGPGDRAIALTALHHDLSVFDIFGMLCCAGGTLVFPDAAGLREPAHWQSLMAREGVTVWNTVPAFMGMLVDHLEANPGARLPLRWCILSGDFIPVPLPDRMRAVMPGLEVVAAGGPTETTVWDICHPVGSVDTSRPSIPYGRPMTNARYHILKDNLDACPDWTPGELFIGGVGLARGYWRDPETTAAKFIEHPVTGERLYRSGDMGRWLPDGTIEILARRDFQVKIQGQRIELGEIEAALEGLPQVERAVVTLGGEDGRRTLVAHVVPSGGGIPASQPAAAPDAMEFKLRQPGVRRPAPGDRLLPLPPAETDAAGIMARQSHRRFTGEAVPAEALSVLLAGLRQNSVDGAALPKYAYPSPGSLYPVQAYLHVRPGGVAGVDAGFHYYHPQQHALVRVGDDVGDLYSGPNAPLFAACAFTIMLVGNLDAVEPLYPGAGRDFCLIEAGHIGQLLMQRAADGTIGLCGVGMGVDEARLRAACGLGDRHLLAYAMVGGGIEAAWKTRWMSHAAPAAAVAWHEPLRRALADVLPAHMVPSVYVRRTELPLTANGKVDRRRLAELPMQAPEANAPPATEAEAMLAALLAEILGAGPLDVQTQFFELGANSLTLVQFRNRIRQEWGRTVPMADLFAQGTIRRLAHLIDGGPDAAVTSLREATAGARRRILEAAGTG